MTKSKAFKILYRFPQGTVLFNLVDHFGMRLESTKNLVENKPFNKSESDFKAGYITVFDVITALNSCQNLNDKFQIEGDRILYRKWDLMTIRDICDNIHKLSKSPETLNFMVPKSFKDYNLYVAEHKEEMDKRIKNLLNIYGYFANMTKY